MALKQQQDLKQTQRLSPLQMQVIKLVELTSVELEDKVKQEIEENPALDILSEGSEDESGAHSEDSDGLSEEVVSQEDIILNDYKSEDEVPDFRLDKQQKRNEPDFIEATYSNETSLYDYLMEQIALRDLTNDDAMAAEYIIGNLDESGYLSRELSSISDDLLFQGNIDISVAELSSVLKIIQDLDPPGVGARNLQECLMLQLQRIKKSDSYIVSMRILTDLFEAFSRKHYDKILKQLDISEEELEDAINLIVSLNPKPGNSLGGATDTAFNNITPDFIVECYNDEITMYLNNKNIPELKVSRDFSDMMEGYSQNREGMSGEDKQALLFMKQKLDSAKWFIDAVKQRQNTLQKTMEAIIMFQRDFFLTEDETKLKPMILKDIAERTNLDISTISRVSNSKYVQTNGGVYPLKFFFSESMQNDAGEDISSREIKFILKESIETENSLKPLTDDQLTKILNDKGYIIARRTVAKYREQLNIPVARLRKQYKVTDKEINT